MATLNFLHSLLLPLILSLLYLTIADIDGSIGVNKIQVVGMTSPSGPGDAHGAGKTWCVANGKVGVKKLQAELDYACGEGGADCRPIQKGGTCYDPNTVEAHASYAFNSYYQIKAHRNGTCNFGGAAHVVTQPPKFGNCKFPTY